MKLINRIKMSIRDARKLEDLNAKAEKAEADITYVAMMTDVDIPTEEANNEGED